MKIIVNGAQEEYTDIAWVSDLVEKKGFKPERVVIEYNGDILAAGRWRATALKDGDTLEIVSFVGGG